MTWHNNDFMRIGIEECSPPAIGAIGDDIVLTTTHELHVIMATPSKGDRISCPFTFLGQMVFSPLRIVSEYEETRVL